MDFPKNIAEIEPDRVYGVVALAFASNISYHKIYKAIKVSKTLKYKRPEKTRTYNVKGSDFLEWIGVIFFFISLFA